MVPRSTPVVVVEVSACLACFVSSPSVVNGLPDYRSGIQDRFTP